MKTRSEELFEKVEACNFGCIAGSLECNADYIELRSYVRKLGALVEQQKVHLTILDDLGFSVGVNEAGHAYVQHNGLGKRYTISEIEGSGQDSPGGGE